MRTPTNEEQSYLDQRHHEGFAYPGLLKYDPSQNYRLYMSHYQYCSIVIFIQVCI